MKRSEIPVRFILLLGAVFTDWPEFCHDWELEDFAA
jgi:hypothetical protein